jgi:predicted nucleic acid-binding protein
VLERLKDKDIILDTNVIIYGVEHQEEFAQFFWDLRELNVGFVVSHAILYEFLCGCKQKVQLEKKLNFLKLFLKGTSLPITKETFEDARKISNIYGSRGATGDGQVTIVDCIIAAQMKHFNESGERLFLATSDNFDYPLIFDRIGVKTYDLGNFGKMKGKTSGLVNIGIYTFNINKYNELVEQFDFKTLS